MPALPDSATMQPCVSHSFSNTLTRNTCSRVPHFDTQTWVDPNQWSSVHPEWFGGSQQLCYSSPTLLQYLTVRAREFLAGSPNASIITLAQNDNQDYCKTPPEMEIIEAEGGAPSGPLLRAINFIAANLSVDFPNVAVDTLAYQYTRKAPNTTRPSPNVIVRLCDIEANFGVPLSDMNDSTNAAFASDLRAWAEISERLYIWGKCCAHHCTGRSLSFSTTTCVSCRLCGRFLKHGDAVA